MPRRVSAERRRPGERRADTHHGDDVRDSVAAVNHGPRQRPFAHLSGRPGGSQRQDGLQTDTESRCEPERADQRTERRDLVATPFFQT